MIQKASHRFQNANDPFIKFFRSVHFGPHFLEILFVGDLEQEFEKHFVGIDDVLGKSHDLIIFQYSVDPAPDDLTWQVVVRLRNLVVVVVQLVDDVTGVDAPQTYRLIQGFQLVQVLLVAQVRKVGK